MIPATSFAGRTVALFGLGGSGVATALSLQTGGAKVVAFDDDAARVGDAAAAGIATGDLREADWSRFAALVLSPGVPLTHPRPHWSVERAREANVEIVGDVELFCRERDLVAPGSPFVAITGTNGKSTTTALLAHILSAAGRDVQMGGNIGTAILSLEPPAPGRVHVIEMSSFQIDLTPSLRPSIGLLINVTPDHLDRHGTMQAYAAIKERLVAAAALALVGVDDPISDAIGRRLSEREGSDVYPVSAEHELRWGYFAHGSRVLARGFGEAEEEALVLGDLAGIGSLRGIHNAQNAAFACAAAWHCGVAPNDIAAALRSFPGLAHRMEQAGRRGRVLFVNDSKATNADSTQKALASFPKLYWILGGRAKAGGIEGLAPYFERVRKAYLIGEASEDFARTFQGRVEFARCGSLERAVAQAAEDAAGAPDDEPVVLFSPACASYDQFKNFEARGDRFRELVRALPGTDTLPGG